MLKFLPEVLYAKSNVQSYQSNSLEWVGSGHKSALELRLMLVWEWDQLAVHSDHCTQQAVMLKSVDF